MAAPEAAYEDMADARERESAPASDGDGALQRPGRASLPRDGLSLAALAAFAATHAGSSFTVDTPGGGSEVVAFERLTTAQAVDHIIKPITAQHGCCSYAQHLLAQGASDAAGRPFVARATAFVSHAWHGRIAETIEALHQAPDAASQYFWFDPMVNYQHVSPEPFQAAWASVYREVLLECGRTVSVLQPWEAPLPLRRAPCLWELHSTLQAGLPLHIVQSGAHRDALRDALASRFLDVSAALSTLDFGSPASCKDPVILTSIHAGVAESGLSLEEACERIRERLCDWQAQQAADVLAGEETPAAAAARLALVGNLANLLRDSGKLAESEPLYRTALEARRATLGDTHAKTLAALNNLASLCMNQGKLEEAEPLYREALQARTLTLGPTHPRTLATAVNLANALKNQGRPAEAEPLFRDALTARMASPALGESHADTVAVSHQLGNVLAEQGKHEEAAERYAHVHAQWRRTFGPDHPDVQAVAIKLAAVSSEAQGQREQSPLAAARSLRSAPAQAAAQQQAASPMMPPPPAQRQAAAEEAARAAAAEAAVMHAAGDASDAAVAAALAELAEKNARANALMGEGKPLEAEVIYGEVQRGRGTYLGKAHADTLAAANNRGIALKNAGRLRDAERLLLDTLGVGRGALGATHAVVLAAAGNLGNVLHDSGQLREAEKLYREVYKGRRATQGEAHPDTLAAANNLAVGLECQGKLAEAVPLCVAALEGRKANLGPRHADTLSCATNLASMLARQGKSDAAYEMYRDALAGLRENLGTRHPSTLSTLNNLACLLMAAGALPEAKALCSEALAGRRAVLGNNHPETLSSLSNLVVLLMREGALDAAVALCRELLHGRSEALGEGHPKTTAARETLGRLLAAQQAAHAPPRRAACCF